MVDVDTRVDDVDINSLAAVLLILVLGESTKGKPLTMADTRETLR
jgi:hypothetical protein